MLSYVLVLEFVRKLYFVTDACKAGFFSETGTLPCSACEVGSYNDAYGGTECTSCPRAETTLSYGAITNELCQGKHPSFKKLNQISCFYFIAISMINLLSKKCPINTSYIS